MVRIIFIQITSTIIKQYYFLHSEYWSAVLFYNGQSPWQARNPGDKRWRLSERRPASKKNTTQVNKWKRNWRQNFMATWHHARLWSNFWIVKKLKAEVPHRLHTFKLLSLLDLLQFAHIVQWLLLKVLPHGFHLAVCLWRWRTHTMMIIGTDMHGSKAEILWSGWYSAIWGLFACFGIKFSQRGYWSWLVLYQIQYWWYSNQVNWYVSEGCIRKQKVCAT